MEHDLLTGLGVDIVEVTRMERILSRTPSFKKRVFSDAEQAYCNKKHKPFIHYAMRFAAKEAVLKALGTGFSRGIKPTDIEVVHDEAGRPQVKLYGRAKEISDASGVLQVHISLSRTRDTAVANAVAVTEASRRKVKDEGPSAKEEIAAAFKELRSMLDNMDDDVEAGAANSEESEQE